jgi:hypothetical protein
LLAFYEALRFQSSDESSSRRSVTWTSPPSYSSTSKGVRMPKRETKPSEFGKAKAGITSASVPYKLRCLRTEYPAINPSLYSKASLIRTTAGKQRRSSITLASLLFLMKRLKLTLLTFSTRLNISTL